MPAAVTVTKKTPMQASPIRRTVGVVQKPTPTKVSSVAKEPVKVQTKVQVKEQEQSPVPDESLESPKVHVEAKKRRQRPRMRPYAEVYSQIHEDINTAYKALQAATRALKSLESAHNREVNNTRSRTNTHRTPTIVFDQAMVDYFTSRLDPSELTVSRKEQNGKVDVDLSNLNTETRVHRTDATQLYSKAFIKHDLRDKEDRRFILYQNDPELVALLTEGYTNPEEELKKELQQIRDGTYKLSIFNIQRFTSQHLNKVELPTKTATDDAVAE